MTAATTPSHVDAMDRMYRYTRHVYDASRKYYLFGRDTLIRRMAAQLQPGEHVCEIGCGTARNLVKLADRADPSVRLYGIDAANVMIQTARGKLARRGLSGRVTLRQGLAEQLHHRRMFDLAQPLDAVFFSYSLSMIPTWISALEAALQSLRPGGRLYIVDFCDQQGLPGPVAGALQKWLALFHVHYRPELLDALHRLAQEGRITLEIEAMFGRYAYIATARRV
jgi:S-adenosylmethionine-diacylgycerolhomoserine-N-methlytransferase